MRYKGGQHQNWVIIGTGSQQIRSLIHLVLSIPSQKGLGLGVEDQVDDIGCAPVEFTVRCRNRHINKMFHHRMGSDTRGEHWGCGHRGVPHTTREVRTFWERYPKWHPHSHAQFQRFY